MLQQQEHEQKQEQDQRHEQEQQQIGDTRTKVMAIRKGIRNQQRIPKYSLTSARKSKTQEAHPFGIQMITDRFGDRWHKCIVTLFRAQRIEALFGDGWHK